MKFTWGHGISAVIALIVISFSTVAIKSMNKDHQLVADDYYALEMKYQNQIDKKNNVISDKKSVNWKMGASGFTLQMNAEDAKKIKGEVYFFRPSDSKLDFKLDLTMDEQGKLMVPASKFVKGYYNLSVDWEVDGKKYFHKENIYIQ